MIGIRLSPDKRKAVEAWAKTALDKPSLSEAVRRLVELGLASAHRSAARMKKAMEASEMAGQEIDRLGDPPATDEERQRRKRRLVKGPKEFRDIRGNRPEFKSSGPTYPRSHSRRAPAGPNLCERCSSGVSATAAEDRAAPLYFQP